MASNQKLLAAMQAESEAFGGGSRKSTSGNTGAAALLAMEQARRGEAVGAFIG